MNKELNMRVKHRENDFEDLNMTVLNSYGIFFFNSIPMEHFTHVMLPNLGDTNCTPQIPKPNFNGFLGIL